MIQVPDAAFIALEVSKRYLEATMRNRKAVFLAPTVPTVRQIFQVAEQFGELRACHVIGSSTVDAWEKEEWEERLHEKDVLVTTPQLFLDILGANLIDFSLFGVLVLHECQHCSGSHPFAKLFSDHYVKPGCQGEMRVLDLSRNLVKRKVKEPTELQRLIRRLEKTMDSQVLSFDVEKRSQRIDLTTSGLKKARTLQSVPTDASLPDNMGHPGAQGAGTSQLPPD